MILHDIFGRELFRYESPESVGAAPSAPGAGVAVPGVPAPTSAETITTEGAGTPPGPIPYARFQEVNEARKAIEEAHQPYADLEELGYDAANLQRLATWEQEYAQDPVGTWLRQADEINDFPEELKTAIQTHMQAGGSVPKEPLTDGAPAPSGSEQPNDSDPPEYLRPIIADYEARQAQQEQEAISGFYDGLVKAWKDLDTTQGLATPDEAIHAHLAAASPTATSAEELLRTGRETWLKVREATLSSEIQIPGRSGLVPQSVPGGAGAAGAATAVRPRSLREATRMAAADKLVNPTGS